MTDAASPQSLAEVHSEDTGTLAPESRDRRADDPRDLDPRLRVIVDTLLAKRGLDIVVMDLHPVTDVADYFVLCTGTSDLHVRSLAEDVVDRLKDSGHRPWHVEGMAHRRWVLVDAVDIVIHVFRSDAREHYALERLWGDAELYAVEDDAGQPATAALSADRERIP